MPVHKKRKEIFSILLSIYFCVFYCSVIQYLSHVFPLIQGQNVHANLTSCNTALFSRCWNGFDPLPEYYNNKASQFVSSPICQSTRSHVGARCLHTLKHLPADYFFFFNECVSRHLMAVILTKKMHTDTDVIKTIEAKFRIVVQKTFRSIIARISVHPFVSNQTGDCEDVCRQLQSICFYCSRKTPILSSRPSQPPAVSTLALNANANRTQGEARLH